MKAVLFACGLGVALCSGPLAAVGADVPVRVEAKKIVILDCGYAKLQEELKRTLDYITDGDVKILKPAHVPPFGSFVIRLGQAPVKTTEQLLEEGDETAAPGAKGQVDWQVDEKGVRIWGELRRGVFAFLNRELGVEWPWYDVIVAEKRHTLVFALVDGWKAAGLKEYYLRPNRRVYFNFRFLPVGYDRYFFGLLKELHAKGGLVGLDSDGPAAGSRQHYMECWYLLKFLQDPTKNFAHWERLWCSFFGPAADDVAKYYAYWREEVWEKRFVPQLDKLDIGAAKAVYANLGRYYREQDFVTAGAHLERGLGRADLGPVARKMLEDLKTDNEHGRIFVRAWIGRKPEQVRDLVDYRKTHGLPSHWGYEKEFLELSTKD